MFATIIYCTAQSIDLKRDGQENFFLSPWTQPYPSKSKRFCLPKCPIWTQSYLTKSNHYIEFEYVHSILGLMLQPLCEDLTLWEHIPPSFHYQTNHFNYLFRSSQGNETHYHPTKFLLLKFIMFSVRTTDNHSKANRS